jgi:monoterpene epsilon-lactone hydrolase
MQEAIATLRTLRDEAPQALPDPTEELRVVRERAEMLATVYPAPGDVRVQAVDAGGVFAELLVTPGADESRVVLYLHGGAYVAYSPRSHRELASRIGRAAGAAVLVPDYRLAPEHPYPAAVEDALASLHWLRAGGRSVVVAGDSAGGGLALALVQRLRDRGEEQPRGVALLSPWTDLSLTGDSVTSVEDDPSLDAERLRQFAELYAAGKDVRDPELSAAYADLSGLPPLHIEVGSGEILLSDSTRLAQAARASGVEVTLEVGEGLPHVFSALATAPEALASTNRIGAFLARCLS